MLIDKVLGNIYDDPSDHRRIDRVYLEWYEFDKKLLRKVSEDGEELGICVHHLHDGDILHSDERKLIVVKLLPCELTVINVDSMKEMGRLCFELGNRHLSLSIEEGKVSIPYDEPTFEYLKKLDFQPQKIEDKFNNFMVCRGHQHG